MVGSVRRDVAAVARRDVRRQLARDRRYRHHHRRPGVRLYRRDAPLAVPRRRAPVRPLGRAVPRRRRRRRPRRGGAREAGDGVMGRPPRRLPDAAARPRLRREVDADVDEDHDAGGDVEGAERRVQDVADLLAELERKQWVVGLLIWTRRWA